MQKYMSKWQTYVELLADVNGIYGNKYPAQVFIIVEWVVTVVLSDQKKMPIDAWTISWLWSTLQGFDVLFLALAKIWLHRGPLCINVDMKPLPYSQNITAVLKIQLHRTLTGTLLALLQPWPQHSGLCHLGHFRTGYQYKYSPLVWTLWRKLFRQRGAQSLLTLKKICENVFIPMIRKWLQIMVVLLHKPIVYNLNILLCKFLAFVCSES